MSEPLGDNSGPGASMSLLAPGRGSVDLAGPPEVDRHPEAESRPNQQITGRSQEPAPAGPSASGGGPWLLAVLVVAIGGFMSVLDTSIVNVAVPVIQKEFGTSTDDIQWISTAYSLALGIIVPVSGWLGDRFGLRRLYIAALLTFAAGSVLCGIAWDLPSMVIFRIIQAIPGGILPVVSLTMLYRVAPKGKMGAAMGIFGLSVVFAPGIGPTLGGYLVEYLDWRLIFFINIPVGLLGAVLALLVLPPLAGVRAGPFDFWGFLTVSSACFALLLGLSEGQLWGWTSYPILVLLAGSINLLGLFVIIELQVEHPLLDVRVFRLWQFTNSLLLITALSVGLFAVLFYIPLFLQEGQYRTPLNTGWLMLPEAVAMAAAMMVGGKLYDQVGPRLPSLLGLVLAAWGTYLLCGITADMTAGEVIIWTSIRGAGNGLAVMTVMTAGLAVVPASQVNQASAINNAVQRIAAALGLAVLTSFASTRQAQFMFDRSALMHPSGADAHPRVAEMLSEGQTGLIPLWQELRVQVFAQAYSNVFLVIAAITALGALLALMLKNSPPEDPEAGGARAEPKMMAH
jgi:EmrB/QacA subfamily drug resistance transporter